MTYAELTNRLREIGRCHPAVSSVHFNVFKPESNDVSYPMLDFINTGITISGGTVTYSFTVMYVDQLMSDGSNALDIQSTGVSVINEVNNRLYNKGVNNVENTLNMQVFRDQFADKCAGVVATDFNVVTSSNDCVCFDDCNCKD